MELKFKVQNIGSEQIVVVDTFAIISDVASIPAFEKPKAKRSVAEILYQKFRLFKLNLRQRSARRPKRHSFDYNDFPMEFQIFSQNSV